MATTQPPISQVIAHHLEQLILDGSLAPDQKIPSERQLSARLGVSRAVIREALHELQGRGAVVTRHGKGSFVAGAPTAASPHTQQLSEYNQDDLLEVRELLEGQAALLAADRSNGEDLSRITQALAAMQATDPSDRKTQQDSFDRAIAKASRNPVLEHILNDLRNLTQPLPQASDKSISQPQTDHYNQQIYAAVTARQPQQASKAAVERVRYLAELLRDADIREEKIIRSATEDSAAPDNPADSPAGTENSEH